MMEYLSNSTEILCPDNFKLRVRFHPPALSGHRIGLRGLTCGWVIQTEVLIILMPHDQVGVRPNQKVAVAYRQVDVGMGVLDQGCFATLTRDLHQYDWKDFQSFGEPPLDKARIGRGAVAASAD